MASVNGLGLNFEKGNGLITAIIQDSNSNEVLMCGFMNKEALQKTLDTGRTCFWSRSRQRLWMKGEQSGNVQNVREILVDCDGDTLVIKVEQTTAACHEGYKSCFFRKLENGKTEVIGEKVFNPKEVYGERK